MYHVYILKGERCYYIGQTNDLHRRYNQHITGAVESTSRMGTLELVGYFLKDTRNEAIKLEKMMKRNGHIQHWINHPTFIKV